MPNHKLLPLRFLKQKNPYIDKTPYQNKDQTAHHELFPLKMFTKTKTLINNSFH